MSVHLYGAFVLACVLLAITPGPNMSLFVANGATYGLRAALLTVAGSAVGLAILVAAAALGMTSVMAFVAEWFSLIRWIGVAYLLYLGVMRLSKAFRGNAGDEMPPPIRRGRWFWQGTAMSLSNPKVLLFLGAFFPQFLDPAAAAGPQLALLAVTFVATIALVDTSLALALGSARGWFTAQRQRFADGFSGVLLICGGLWLAAARRS